MKWLLGTFGWFVIGLLVFWLTRGHPEFPQTLISGAMMALERIPFMVKRKHHRHSRRP